MSATCVEDQDVDAQEDEGLGHRSFGARCKDCGGEDCPCCEVFLEWKADQNHASDYPDEPDYDQDPGPEEDDCYEEDLINLGYDCAEKTRATESIEQLSPIQRENFMKTIWDELGPSAANSFHALDSFLDGYEQYVKEHKS